MVHLKEGKVGECNIATHVKSQKVKSQKFFEFIYLSLFKVSTTDIVKNYVELEILTGNDLIFFFNCYLAAPRPTLDHYRGGSLTHPMLITAFLPIRPEGHREPHNEVGCLSPAEG